MFISSSKFTRSFTSKMMATKRGRHFLDKLHSQQENKDCDDLSITSSTDDEESVDDDSESSVFIEEEEEEDMEFSIPLRDESSPSLVLKLKKQDHHDEKSCMLREMLLDDIDHEIYRARATYNPHVSCVDDDDYEEEEEEFSDYLCFEEDFDIPLKDASTTTSSSSTVLARKYRNDPEKLEILMDDYERRMEVSMRSR